MTKFSSILETAMPRFIALAMLLFILCGCAAGSQVDTSPINDTTGPITSTVTPIIDSLTPYAVEMPTIHPLPNADHIPVPVLHLVDIVAAANGGELPKDWDQARLVQPVIDAAHSIPGIEYIRSGQTTCAVMPDGRTLYFSNYDATMSSFVVGASLEDRTADPTTLTFEFTDKQAGATGAPSEVLLSGLKLPIALPPDWGCSLGVVQEGAALPDGLNIPGTVVGVLFPQNNPEQAVIFDAGYGKGEVTPDGNGGILINGKSMAFYNLKGETISLASAFQTEGAPIITPETSFVPEGFSIGPAGLLKNPETDVNELALNKDADWTRVAPEIQGALWQASRDWYAYTGETSDALNYATREEFIKAAQEGQFFTIGIPERDNINWDNVDTNKYKVLLSIKSSLLELNMVRAKLDNIHIQFLDPDAFKQYMEGKGWLDKDMPAFSPVAMASPISDISATLFEVDGNGDLVISIGSYSFRDVPSVPMDYWVGRFAGEQGIGSQADRAVTHFLGRIINKLEYLSEGEEDVVGLDGTTIKYVSISKISQRAPDNEWYLSPPLIVFNK